MLERLWRSWHRRDIQKRIDRHGWTAIYVGDYHSAPTWAYTIGFRSSLDAPEIIVFDVPQEQANGLFHEVYNDLKSGRLTLRDGERWRPDELETPVVWRRVHPSQLRGDEDVWMGLAEMYDAVRAPQTEFEAYQLVLSDAEGHLPWEAGYDERLRPRQPPLWEPADLAVKGGV